MPRLGQFTAKALHGIGITPSNPYPLASYYSTSTPYPTISTASIALKYTFDSCAGTYTNVIEDIHGWPTTTPFISPPSIPATVIPTRNGPINPLSGYAITNSGTGTNGQAFVIGPSTKNWTTGTAWTTSSASWAVESWVNITTNTTYQFGSFQSIITSSGGSGFGVGLLQWSASSASTYLIQITLPNSNAVTGASNYQMVANNFVVGSWNHIVVQWAASGTQTGVMSVFVNGYPQTQWTNGYVLAGKTGTQDFWWGTYPAIAFCAGSGATFPMIYDNIRLLTTAPFPTTGFTIPLSNP